jgi:hypothetical protein
MRVENVKKVCTMMRDSNTFVAEMAVRILFVFAQSDTSKWTHAFFCHMVFVIKELTACVKWAHAHLLDADTMQAHEDRNKHDKERFSDVILQLVIFGTSTIWACCYRLLEYVSKESKNRADILCSLNVDELISYFEPLALMSSGFGRVGCESASGIISVLTSCRSLRHPDHPQLQIVEIMVVLTNLMDSTNVIVRMNAFTAVSQLLSRTCQTLHCEDAVSATLKAKMWTVAIAKLRNKKSELLTHANKLDLQIAAAVILMYLSQHVDSLVVGVEDVEALSELLLPALPHVHVFVAATVWGLAQDTSKRELLAVSNVLSIRLAAVMQNSASSHKACSPLEPREWAAGALFAMMHSERFVQKVVTETNVIVRLVGVLVEGTKLARVCVPLRVAEDGPNEGSSEYTVWANKRKKTSSTLLFCVIGALWLLVEREEARCPHASAECLNGLPVACTVAALALYTSQIEGPHAIKCPQLRRSTVGLAQTLHSHRAHRTAVQASLRKDIMEFLLVGLLTSPAPDLSSRCDAAIGISICAMEVSFLPSSTSLPSSLNHPSFPL